MLELQQLQTSANKSSGQLYYSVSRRGFVVEGIHSDIDKTVDVPLTSEEHQALLDGNSQGKTIKYDNVNKKVILVDPEPIPRDKLLTTLEIVVDKYLNDFAKTRGYSSIDSACSYKGSTNPTYNLEGSYCMRARDTVWESFYVTLTALQQDATMPIPTAEQLIETLPVLTWPE